MIWIQKMRTPERVWKNKIKKQPSGSGTQDLGVTIFHTRVKNNLNSKNAEINLHVQFSHRILSNKACACQKKQFWIRDASLTNSCCKSERPGHDKKVSQINFSHSRENVWEAQHVCSVSLGYKDLYFRSNPDYFHTTSTQPLHELVIPTLVPDNLPRWTSSTRIKGAKKKFWSEKRPELLELTKQRQSTSHTKILHIIHLQNRARIVQILCIICPVLLDNFPMSLQTSMALWK